MGAFWVGRASFRVEGPEEGDGIVQMVMVTVVGGRGELSELGQSWVALYVSHCARLAILGQFPVRVADQTWTGYVLSDSNRLPIIRRVAA